jgi:uncharacterized tellurite resistance protein B-like protein
MRNLPYIGAYRSEADMDKIDKVEICKLVAQAILADGKITDTERDFLAKLMNRYGLSDLQQKEVVSINIGQDPSDGVKMLASNEARNELLVELALAVAVDGEISASERRLLNRVAETLDVSEADLELMLKAAIA